MRILAVNAGSSSLRLTLVGDGDEVLASAHLGPPADEATRDALTRFVDDAGDVDAVGHRIVHGGPDLRGPVIVTQRVRQQLDAVADLAPLHVPPALAILDQLRDRLHVPHAACFDTAFHATLSPAASTYPVPDAWRTRYGIRRYGFHGLSCAWSLGRAAGILGRAPHELSLVVAHLGAGASVTAIRDGRSADTSMGFTPLEGLAMATRSGSVDPGALLWLQAARGMPAAEMSDALEHASGLLGLAGTPDMRQVLDRAGAGDSAAQLAVDVYVHRARRCIGAVAASLTHVDALVFTGGVGEGSAQVRRAVCSGLGIIGIVEPAIVDVPEDQDAVISSDGAQTSVLVVHAREDLQIAHEVRTVLTRE